MAGPSFLEPFVLDPQAVTAQRVGNIDVYASGQDLPPSPAVLFVHGGPLPVDLRPAREQPQVAATVTAFVDAAAEHQVAVDVIDVPDGQHSFDILDHTPQSREAITAAVGWVARAVTG